MNKTTYQPLPLLRKYLRQIHTQPGWQTDTHPDTYFLILEPTERAREGTDSFFTETELKAETVATTDPTVAMLYCTSCLLCANHGNTTLSNIYQSNLTKKTSMAKTVLHGCRAAIGNRFEKMATTFWLPSVATTF